ncbi:FtsK/SpoIIIE domain-containing protein [Gorillibacterium sp. sgz5001074]|uniref:FtsK/SpoIIIE domain-containing protein n=1 Tax=Gorillibacterium sp. sgz5001074 TaxID=3446695 RepID=UPI003F665AB7
MNVVKQLHSVLNRMVESDIKQHRTTGFHHIDSRRVLCGSEHAFRLPIGKSAQDIHKHLDAVQASVGSPVEVIDRGGVVVLRVVEKDLGMVRPNEEHFRRSEIIIGYNRLQQPIYHSMNAHLLTGGGSGSGKTEALRYWIWQLVRHGCEIRICDLKGFSFIPFEILPHVYIAKDMFEARDMLVATVSEMMRRKELVLTSRNRDVLKGMRTIVTIIDEAAALSPKQNSGKLKEVAQDCDDCIAILGQQAREPKMPVILATQRPSYDAVNLQFRANCEASVAFRVKDRSNSELIIGHEGAERISPHTPGRCIYAYDRDHTLQVPFVGDDRAWERTLEPLKVQVIDGGRSTAQRANLRGANQSPDSQHVTVSETKRQPKPKEESKRRPTGAGAREVSGKSATWKRKGMAVNGEGAETLRDISDEIG